MRPARVQVRERASHLGSGRTRCIRCGQEQFLAPEPAGRCVRCDEPLASAQPLAPLPRKDQPAFRFRFSEQALASLVSDGFKSEVPAMADELFAIDKRCNSFLAFIPILGPLWIRRSQWHSEEEKQRLSALSIGLTLAILAFLWSLQPSTTTQAARLHHRIDSEISVLAQILEEYRKEHGSYPDEATWRRFTERADPRFVDPWGRPYRYQYERSKDTVVVQTLGQDGVEGGSGKDADVTMEHRPPLENPAPQP